MSVRTTKSVAAVIMVIAIIALLFPFGVSCNKPPAPKAGFAIGYVSGELLKIEENYVAGLAPLTLQFADQSTGEITSWKWNLGDGTVLPGGGELKNVTHTYETVNSSGYTIVLTVQGPGGRDDETKEGIVTVLSCSEGANSELNQARQAIQACLNAAGKTKLDKEEPAWDGSRGKVTAGNGAKDAADYLGVWKTFRATYEVELDGTIAAGTDVTWGCVYWGSNLGKMMWVAIR